MIYQTGLEKAPDGDIGKGIIGIKAITKHHYV
jgi:hypothetical protein